MDIQNNRIQDLAATDQLATTGGDLYERAMGMVFAMAIVGGVTVTGGLFGLAAVAGGVLLYVG